MMFLASTGKRQVMFLLKEQDLASESFLDDINNLINNGEISGLIGREQQDRINVAMQDEARIQKVETLAYFNQRMRNRFHIVLCLSPVGDQLRQRFRK